jgi:soluble lytic murein transglycosylase-like protein
MPRRLHRLALSLPGLPIRSARVEGRSSWSNTMRLFALALTLIAVAQPAFADRPRQTPPGSFTAMVARHAQMNGIPESLVHRVIARESHYNAGLVSRGNYGLMQIRLGTAREMGYRGSAAGLLDAETNMTYAVKYLAGAYRRAGSNHDRAVAYYARGYNAGGSDAVATRRGYAAYAPVSPASRRSGSRVKTRTVVLIERAPAIASSWSAPPVAHGRQVRIAMLRQEPPADPYAWESPEKRHQIY